MSSGNSSNPAERICARPELKISCVLMDVDGTMTRLRPGGKLPVDADVRLAELLAEDGRLSMARAISLIHQQENWDQHCIFDLAQKLNIEETRLWDVLVEDWKRYISFPEDTVFFLKEMNRKKIPVYAATTNSPRMTLMKMSIGGLADIKGTPFLSGFYSGNHFHDPRGKFAPDFFQKILAEGRFNPRESVMIGDEYLRDCAPALTAGIRWCILIDRNSRIDFTQNDEGVIRTNSLHCVAPCILKAEHDFSSK